MLRFVCLLFALLAAVRGSIDHEVVTFLDADTPVEVHPDVIRALAVASGEIEDEAGEKPSIFFAQNGEAAQQVLICLSWLYYAIDFSASQPKVSYNSNACCMAELDTVGSGAGASMAESCRAGQDTNAALEFTNGVYSDQYACAAGSAFMSVNFGKDYTFKFCLPCSAETGKCTGTIVSASSFKEVELIMCVTLDPPATTTPLESDCQSFRSSRRKNLPSVDAKPLVRHNLVRPGETGVRPIELEEAQHLVHSISDLKVGVVPVAQEGRRAPSSARVCMSLRAGRDGSFENECCDMGLATTEQPSTTFTVGQCAPNDPLSSHNDTSVVTVLGTTRGFGGNKCIGHSQLVIVSFGYSGSSWCLPCDENDRNSCSGMVSFQKRRGEDVSLWLCVQLNPETSTTGAMNCHESTGDTTSSTDSGTFPSSFPTGFGPSSFPTGFGPSSFPTGFGSGSSSSSGFGSSSFSDEE